MEEDNPENIIEEIQNKILNAFDVFDNSQNKTVDVKDVGNIVRSFGCCPTEAELNDILAELEDEENGEYVTLEKFLPLMTKILIERRFTAASEDQLMKAFQVLDTDEKGYITYDEIRKYMTEEGEPFNEDEMEQMATTALQDDGNLYYKNFVPVLIDDITQ